MSTTLTSIRQACTAQCRISTPLGPLLLVRTAVGLAGAWFDQQRHHPTPWDAPHVSTDALLQRAAQQLARYFEGGEAPFDVPLDLHGTAFQRSVWHALLRIERGTTLRYGDIAAQLGASDAARAVGAAVGRNPVSIIVPCHRVLGSGGALTGYAGGLERKVALLEIEQARAPSRRQVLPPESPQREQPLQAAA
jgi:methylated-DNA-[protein]-cysteine S-methyltransferase